MSETVSQKVSTILGNDKVTKQQFKSLLENSPTRKSLDIVKFNNFNPENGVKLNVEKIFGLSSKWESKYYQALVEVIDINPPNNHLARVLSQNVKMKSCIRYRIPILSTSTLQKFFNFRSPVWEDDLHPLLFPTLDNSIVYGKISTLFKLKQFSL